MLLRDEQTVKAVLHSLPVYVLLFVTNCALEKSSLYDKVFEKEDFLNEKRLGGGN